MENKIYNDDVERIVNNPERQAKINQRYKTKKIKIQEKLLKKSVLFAILSLAFAVAEIFNFMCLWLSFPALMICGMIASLYFGRWIENVKCRGWK